MSTRYVTIRQCNLAPSTIMCYVVPNSCGLREISLALIKLQLRGKFSSLSDTKPRETVTICSVFAHKQNLYGVT